MPAEIINQGGIIRIEWTRPWYGRLFAAVFLLPALYLAYTVAADIGQNGLHEDLPGLVFFAALAIALFMPGFMLATCRYVVTVDKPDGRVTVAWQFGPLRFGKPRKLSDYHLLSVTRQMDEDTDTTPAHKNDPTVVLDVQRKHNTSEFRVNLCGKGSTRPIVLCGFPRAPDATEFAGKVGAALGLKVRDVSGQEPDDPDYSPRQKPL